MIYPQVSTLGEAARLRPSDYINLPGDDWLFADYFAQGLPKLRREPLENRGALLEPPDRKALFRGVLTTLTS
jgi:hypothetical protein